MTVHLRAFFDETLSLQKNIEKIQESYAALGVPSESNLAKARALVRFYNENLTEAEIGFSDHKTIRTVFHYDGNQRRSDQNTLTEHSPKTIDTVEMVDNMEDKQHD